VLRAIDGFALSVDRGALMDDLSFAPPLIDRSTIEHKGVHYNLIQHAELYRQSCANQRGYCLSIAQRYSVDIACCLSSAQIRLYHHRPFIAQRDQWMVA